MRYSKRCYTKRMQYYLNRKMIEFESEKKTIHCVRTTCNTQALQDIKHIIMCYSFTEIDRKTAQLTQGRRKILLVIQIWNILMKVNELNRYKYNKHIYKYITYNFVMT